MDVDYESEEFDSFAEMREAAEKSSDSLNFPIGWTIYDEQDEDWNVYVTPGVTETPSFELIFLLPRKWGKTWGMRTATFDRAEVQQWLDTFVRGEVMRWYGWDPTS